MTKKKEPKESIESRLTEWLSTQGYNLEMLTAKVFQEEGFRIAPSIHYYDSEIEKTREIDLICYYSKVIHDVTFSLTFVIECKKSIDKPWLVFKYSETVRRYQSWDEVEATLNGKYLMDVISQTTDLRKKNKIGFLPFNMISPGYNVTQAFTSKEDVPYGATMSVLKAVRYFIEKYSKQRVQLCSLYFPLIVIDGKLFDVKLEEDSALKIEEVRESKFVQMRSDLSRATVIQLVTRSHLKSFCKKLKRDCDKFLTQYSSQIDEVVQKYPYSDRFSNL